MLDVMAKTCLRKRKYGTRHRADTEVASPIAGMARIHHHKSVGTAGKRALWGLLLVPLILLAGWLFWLYRSVDTHLDIAAQPEPLRIVVMDPLCRRLVAAPPSDHVPRDYASLGTLLNTRLGRPLEFIYPVRPGEALPSRPGGADLIIGKASVVSLAAAEANEVIRPIARLTDREGRTDVCGLLVVRKNDPAKGITDLADHRILFGPACDEERHSAALAALAECGVAPVPPLQTMPDCNDALLALAEGDTDVAVISSYALPLMEGRDPQGEGTLRVAGRTASLPFITVFATARVSATMERKIVDALLTVKTSPQVLEALDSKEGFVGPDDKPPAESTPPPASPAPSPATEWTDWRGPGRAGMSPDVPTRLPATLKLLWKRGLTGPGHSGVAATATHVIIADKSEQNEQDIWRCLDADTGKELWTIAYGTPKELEFTNAPRATPVIHGGFAYLLGAFGDLHCIAMHSHQILWHRNIARDFGATLPAWGLCSTPLIVDDFLIVNPGAEDASLVALGLYTGEVIWKTPGGPAAPASLILGTFGGARQIIGYDAVSLGGWDPNTGERLWTLLPQKQGDYNVATPVNVNGRLLVATKNNGTRLYEFREGGRAKPVLVAESLDLAPDISTPVTINGLVFGCSAGLFCLDLDDGLKTLYCAEDDEAFKDYAALAAGNDHILAASVEGELVLLEASREAFSPVSRLRVFKDTEVWSHPALVGDRLYLRSMKEVCCILLNGS